MEQQEVRHFIKQGEDYFTQGNFTQAEGVFKSVLEAQPNHTEALNNLGVIAYNQGIYGQASKYLRKAIEIDPFYVSAIENLTYCLMATGNYVETIRLLEKAYDMGVRSSNLKNVMAQCFLIHGDASSEQYPLTHSSTGAYGTDASKITHDYSNFAGLSISGYYGQRSWCKRNAPFIRHLQNYSGLNMQGTRFWEYPFVLKKVMERPASSILDIGIGQGVFASILAKEGHRVIGVDNYESCWNDLESIQVETGIECVNGDARNLLMFEDSAFDIALLISMIEHIPSNTIWCEKRKATKTGDMLKEENPEKLMAIKEALRVVKPGGMVIITSDIYLDYPPEMNISWKQLLGVGGINREDIIDRNDLFIYDNPIHKGKLLPVAITIEKPPSN